MSMSQHKSLMHLARLFLLVFIYAVVAMVVSQELVIPRMTSSLGDPDYYHSLALKKAGEIRSLGISKFELRPEGQGPAGVASLLYLIWENPYGVVVLNAFLHGLSAVTMTMILMRWFSLRTSIIGTLPLVVSPYMIVWFSQLNKDTFALVGALLFTYGLLKLFSKEGKPLLLNDRLFSLVIAVTGILLMWIVRPYVNQILLPITGLIFAMTLFLRARRGFVSNEWMSFAIHGVLVLACLGLFGKGAASDKTLEGFEHFNWQSQAESQAVATNCFASIDERNWRNEKFFPDFVNKKLKAMMGQRCLMFTLLETQANATTQNSFVDMDKLPGGSLEALAYLPRAALFGIFAPWPDRWGYIFNHRPSVFYTITPIEAVALYLGLIGLCVWLIQGGDWSVLIPIVLSVTVMTAYGMSTPFLGALYRYRYPWWVLLICLGVAALVEVSGRKWRGLPTKACA